MPTQTKLTTKTQPKHIQEIPLKYFPKQGKAKEYAKDLLRTAAGVDFANRKIQYSAQLCLFNIKSIMQKSGFTPKSEDVFREIKEFVYHYENYCYRLHAFREKLVQFINAVLPVGYADKDVKIKDMLINPTVKEAGLLPVLEKFNKNADLSKAINDRKKMTHRLYYGEEFDHYLRPMTDTKPESEEEVKVWFKKWGEQIKDRSLLATKCRYIIDDINHDLAEKVVAYKSQKIKN